MTAVPQLRAPRLTYHAIDTIDDLLLHLRWAMGVELSTIPPYLAAQWSIQDPSTPAYTLIRDVVLEEMLHVNLVANLMNAIGGSPTFTAQDTPEYPGFMKHHAAGGPYVQLQPLSVALARNVFMAIEQPEPTPHTPAEGDEFTTIGQFYRAIAKGFEHCVERYGAGAVFGRDTGFQRMDLYFGPGGGHPVHVTDLASAKHAIAEITEQGEGATTPRPPTPGEEPFGAYEYYGLRTDGTYGPILGIPWEMSHYRKFEQIADGVAPLPSVYPMQADPRPDDGSEAVQLLGRLFDGCYTLLLDSLGRTFGSPDATAFYAVGVPMMRVLPLIATQLMQTPLDLHADPSVGPTAGPGFRYRETPAALLRDEAIALLALTPPLGAAYAMQWRATLDTVVATLNGIVGDHAGTAAASIGPTS